MIIHWEQSAYFTIYLQEKLYIVNEDQFEGEIYKIIYKWLFTSEGQVYKINR